MGNSSKPRRLNKIVRMEHVKTNDEKVKKKTVKNRPVDYKRT